jgi:hypothetical protein
MPHLQHGCDRFPGQHIRHRVMDRLCGSGRTRHAIGRVPAWSRAIKPNRKAWTSRE